ncbi:type II toxin-antitoxin system VapC family toxin [Leucobacter massiliensis]|uniref:type II toxin-antitoxin system VapC family toxin n=1 Tax=Leucobacter massiliensis TaxID=1686285 RepID=UPI0015E3E98C|nr:PIN domain-containing protein [Leucobacter massiliensis]
MILLDANVLIAITDANDAHHRAARELVTEADEELASHALTAAEVLLRAAQRGVEEALLRILRDRLGVTVLDGLGPAWPLTVARTRAHTGLRHPDALVLATAEHLDAAVATFDDALARAADRAGRLYRASP